MKLRRLPLLCLFMLYSAAAGAQQVHRCGNLYSDAPCPQGYLVDFDRDTRTPEQKAETDLAAARDKREAARLEQDRIVQEAATVPISRAIMPTNVPLPTAQPGAEPSVPDTAKKKSKSHSTKKTKKQKEPDYFTAKVPGEPKKK